MSRGVLTRGLGVRVRAEAVGEMSAFVAVLMAGAWVWGRTASAPLLAAASGTAFTTVVFGQLATAFACRSESRWVGRLAWAGNPLLLGAVTVEVAVLFVFTGVPPVARLLGGSFPPPLGWLAAVAAIPVVFLADAVHKAVRARRLSRIRSGQAPA